MWLINQTSAQAVIDMHCSHSANNVRSCNLPLLRAVQHMHMLMQAHKIMWSNSLQSSTSHTEHAASHGFCCFC